MVLAKLAAPQSIDDRETQLSEQLRRLTFAENHTSFEISRESSRVEEANIPSPIDVANIASTNST